MKFFLVVLLAFGIAVHVLVFFFQEKLIFYPTRIGPNFPLRFENAAELSIPVDGAVLSALRFRVEKPKGIVVYFHGNAGTLQDWGDTGEMISRLGYDVLIYDYRGFGKSTGKPRSEKDFLEDARSVVAVALKDYPESKLVLFGRSLGSGLAVRLATEMTPKLLLLETPYTSIYGIARARFPYLATSLVLRYPLRNDLYAGKVAAPVEIFHGTEDETIPFALGEAISREFRSPMKFHRIPGGHHNDLETFPDYRDALTNALRI